MERLNLITKLIEKRHDNKPISMNEIVFVGRNIKPRMLKMAYALRKKGYVVKLLISSKDNSSDWDFFDNVIFFSTTQNLYMKCLMMKPLVYHIFTEATVDDWAYDMIVNKDKLGLVVYDQYDIYHGLVREENDIYSIREKYCLENADGLCCRMFETQFLKQRYNYVFKGKRLLFFDYCWNNYSPRIMERQNSAHIKFVYGGRLMRASSNERFKIEYRGFTYWAKQLNLSGDSLTVFPSRKIAGSKLHVYRNIEREYRSIRYKDPLPAKELIKIESEMDYGIDCLELQSDVDKNMKLYYKNKFYATNKYFDYIDAGVVPLYGRKDELFGSYLEKVGGAVKCSLEELPQKLELLRDNVDKYKQQLDSARKELSIDNNIERLIKFYNELNGKVKQRKETIVSVKDNCVGCTACINICPCNCISMKRDAEGFDYPMVSHDRCIGCGKCRKVCPVLNKKWKIKEPVVASMINNDSAIREKSSSGGVFYSIAKEFIRNGGIVCAAKVRNDSCVVHDFIRNIEGIDSFLGSKYVQSDLNDCFKRIKEELENGGSVLFVGTPCQTHGLVTYLNKEYEKLILIDLVCHSVPSPGIWEEYIKAQKGDKKITELSFRNMDLAGWRNFGMKIIYEDGTSYVDKQTDNIFMEGFLRGYYNRRCCYNCQFSNKNRVSDLTMGDFWKVNEYGEDISDNTGVSIVYINSEKGRQLVNEIKDEFTVCYLPKGSYKNVNDAYSKMKVEMDRRILFYKKYNKGMSMQEIMQVELKKKKCNLGEKITL